MSAALSCTAAMRRASRHVNADDALKCASTGRAASDGMSAEGSSDDDGSPTRKAQAPRTRRSARAPRNASKKKTEKPLCLDFLKGDCYRLRQGCRYYHPEPGEVILLEQLADTQVCEVWALSGFCKFGTKCWKEHPERLRQVVSERVVAEGVQEPITKKFQGWMHSQLALREDAEKEQGPEPSPERIQASAGPGAPRDAASQASPDVATECGVEHVAPGPAHDMARGASRRSVDPYVCQPAEAKKDGGEVPPKHRRICQPWPAEAKKVCAPVARPVKEGAADGGEVPPKRCGVVLDSDLCSGLFNAEVLTELLVAAAGSPRLDAAAP